ATGFFSHTSRETPTSNTFESSASRTTVLNFGLQQNIPTGGNYALSWTNSRNAVSAFGALINPSFSSGLAVSVDQPLLRNFGLDINRRSVYIARNTLGINRESFRLALLDTANSVEQAYLDLLYTRQFVDVVRESLFLARDQARITQIRIDVGASAPLDILQPRVQIATSEEALIRAVADVRAAEDRLRQLMHLPPSEWDRPIVPTDRVTYEPTSINVDDAITRAFELRPEVKQNQLASDSLRVQYLYARNQTLPRVDLGLDYSHAGIAGKALAVDPFSGDPTGLSSTNYPHAVRQAIEGTFPAWTVAVSVAVPLTNIGARAEAKRSELDYRQSRTFDEQTRETIVVQIRAAAREVDTAAKEIAASKTARDVAEQNLDAERKRYENGMTTNFQVLQVQQQLSDSRARELQALVNYNKAVTAYHRFVGDLLDVRGIKTEEPVVSPEPQDWLMFRRLDRYPWLNYGSRVNVNEELK
ncbi:MAG TPA: TolC family protein, partial [Thermoanaerobaculia bacterium]|nr:TolC family protein [Thermoanaerobaculia bacterium]